LILFTAEDAENAEFFFEKHGPLGALRVLGGEKTLTEILDMANSSQTEQDWDTDSKDFQSVLICVHLCPTILSVCGAALLCSYVFLISC